MIKCERTYNSDAKLTRISVLSKLWIKHGKSLVLDGVAVNGEIITQEPQKTIALGDAWQPTFLPKSFDELQAKKFLDDGGQFGDYEGVQLSLKKKHIF